jgi:hypothetical protein
MSPTLRLKISSETTRGGREKDNASEGKNGNNPSINEYNVMHCRVSS